VKNLNFNDGLKAAVCCVTLLFVTLFSASVSVADEYLADEGASQRVDASGKLRMLSQRIVAAACYVQADINTQATTEMLVAATEEFQVILTALEFGDAALGMNGAETDIKTLATIEQLHMIWDPIEEIVGKVLSHNATEGEITQMALQSEPLLEMARVLVAAVTAEYSLGASMVMRDAVAIDISGRQRMLAQRISKDVCLIATGIDTEHYREDLEQTARLFDTSLSALRGGMPSVGVLAPTDDQVISGLSIVATNWGIVQSQIGNILMGEEISAEQAAEMFEMANALTADMNKVVVDYIAASNQDF